MHDQTKIQKEPLNARRLFIFVLIFTVIGALLVTLNTWWRHADIFMISIKERSIQAVTTSETTTTIKKNKMDLLYSKCDKGGTEYLERTWVGYSLVHTYPICGHGGSFGRNPTDGIDTYTLMNGKVIVIGSCNGTTGTSDCTVSGNGLELVIGEQCIVYDDSDGDESSSDCEHNYCYMGLSTSGVGTCRCNAYSADSGCSDPYQCFSGTDIDFARGRNQHEPACLLAVGVSSSIAGACISDSLDGPSGTCACNPNTEYGCTVGQECLRNGDSVSCVTPAEGRE